MWALFVWVKVVSQLTSCFANKIYQFLCHLMVIFRRHHPVMILHWPHCRVLHRSSPHISTVCGILQLDPFLHSENLFWHQEAKRCLRLLLSSHCSLVLQLWTGLEHCVLLSRCYQSRKRKHNRLCFLHCLNIFLHCPHLQPKRQRAWRVQRLCTVEESETESVSSLSIRISLASQPRLTELKSI